MCPQSTIKTPEPSFPSELFTDNFEQISDLKCRKKQAGFVLKNYDKNAISISTILDNAMTFFLLKQIRAYRSSRPKVFC